MFFSPLLQKGGTALIRSPAVNKPFTRLEKHPASNPRPWHSCPLQRGNRSCHICCHWYRGILCQICGEIPCHRADDTLVAPCLHMLLTEGMHGHADSDSQACTVLNMLAASSSQTKDSFPLTSKVKTVCTIPEPVVIFVIYQWFYQQLLSPAGWRCSDPPHQWPAPNALPGEHSQATKKPVPRMWGKPSATVCCSVTFIVTPRDKRASLRLCSRMNSAPEELQVRYFSSAIAFREN